MMRRVWCWIVWAVLLWGALSVVLVIAIVWYGAVDRARSADVIVVLGSGVESDGRPSKTLTVRAEHGANQWHAGIAPLIICAGGVTGGAPRSEADACREELVRFGVPAEAVLLEERSINTEENVRYTLDLMAQHELTSAVVVSSRYHMLRSRWLFWRQRADVVTSPARIDYLTRREVFYGYSREWAAFHWQLLRDVFDVPHVYVPVP